MSAGRIRGGFLVRQVLIRSDAEFAAEHGDEGAGAVISGVASGFGDGGSGGQALESELEAEAAEPGAKGQVGFFAKEAFEGSEAGAAG